MPSANNKTDKTPSSDSQDPLRQAIVIIEHKIRNLEKRKTKLDSYKDSGKALSRDVQEAVSKYDEVVQQLDLSKEYMKQFNAICVETDKAKKRALKKESSERTALEAAKIKSVLLIQDVLQNMGTDKTREDFMTGSNGAITLTENDLKHLDDLYLELSPKHGEAIAFQAQVQKAAEHLLAIVDARSRELVGTPCSNLLSIINKIQESGYFDKQREEPAEEDDKIEPERQGDIEIAQQVEEAAVPNNLAPLPLAQDCAMVVPLAVPQPAALPSTIPNPTPMHTLLQNIVPVSQVESSLFNAQGFKPPSTNQATPAPPPQHIPTQPQPTPLNDVMSRVGGKFTFFQDSELEVAEMNAVPPGAQVPPMPSNIPSRTFTNQTFNNQPPAPASMGYPRPPATNPYYVAGFPPMAPPNYNQDMIQGFANAPNVPGAPAPAPAIAMQNQRPEPDNAFTVPQHLPGGFAGQPNAGNAPPAQQFQHTASGVSHQQKIPDEVPVIVAAEVKEPEEPPMQNWPSDRREWANDDWSEWKGQKTEGQSGANEGKEDLPRQDRPVTSDRLQWSNDEWSNLADSGNSEVKEPEEPPMQNWPTSERREWANDDWSEWKGQKTEGQSLANKWKEDLPRQDRPLTSDRLEWSNLADSGNSKGVKSSSSSRPRGDRSDRPRSNNYQGSRGGNRNNYSNNRSGNRENYYNNHNGYSGRGGGDYQRDSRDQNSYKDRGDRGDVNGQREREGGHQRGGAPRRPRVDRDRPPQTSRSNGGGRGGSRGGPRGSASHNSYREEHSTA